MANPKPRPKLLAVRERKASIDALDRAESEKARRRANGHCEIFVANEGRCTRRDSQTHHMLKGWGRRARGNSALAAHKQRCCDRCHRDIEGHVLQRIPDGPLPVFTDAYERIA